MNGWFTGCQAAGQVHLASRVLELLPPTIVFSLVEGALRNETTRQWIDAEVGWKPFFKLLALPSATSERLGSECPFALVATTLVRAIIASRLVAPLEVNVLRSAIARMVRLAESAKPLVLQYARGFDRWRKLFERRWHNLHLLPTWLWQEAGCMLKHESLSLTDLLVSPPNLAHMACISDSAIFSPTRFFGTPGYPASVDKFFLAMQTAMVVRPSPATTTNHLMFLQIVLQEYLANASALQGILLEFGVAKANSSNVTAQHVQDVWQRAGEPGPVPCIFAFDSFEGLPRDWFNLKQGAFSLQPVGRMRPDRLSAEFVLPPTEYNVEFVVGWFNETVQPFLQGIRAAALVSGGRPPKVSMVHLDADLYESTILVLELLMPFFEEGSVLIFDDLNIDFEGGVKENWDAIFEVMQKKGWAWDVEVLLSPWTAWFADLNPIVNSAAFRLTARDVV